MGDKKEELKNQIETLKNIRTDLGLNRKQFSEYMDIPLRTLEEWEAGRRKMPDYVLRLMWYYSKMEKILEDKGSVRREDIDGSK
ncbi:MAG: transcriptional regulator [Lachnospiraceae bacterium]|nr:transcriptional regulator [Lachnospiraceae bacterium]